MKSWTIWLTMICMAVGLASTGMAGNDTPPVLAPGEKTVVRVYYPNTEMANKVIISFEAQLLETNYGKGYHVMRVTREDVDRLTAQ